MSAALAVHRDNIYQDVLIKQLKVIFPNEKPQINVRKTAKFKYSEEASRFLELDVYYPKFNLCFEFQDNYHYVTTWYNQKPVNQIQESDSKKQDVIQRTGMSLVVVPCWWDGAVKSLISTIWFLRPDLVPFLHSKPIPLNPPLSFFTSVVPGVGELMQASFPLTSRAMSRNIWWLGEKYDGVRYCWNPVRKKLYSRQCNEFFVLPKISTSLSSIFTEGEFWFGRGFFPLTIPLVNKIIEYVLWDSFRMLAFDAPPVMQNSPFEIRYEQLMNSIPVYHPFTFVAPRFLFKKRLSHNFFIQMIVSDGGEGIILRKRGSLYENGRSFSLLKLKSVFGDMEGIVIGISRKAVYLQLPNGASFTVPAEDVQLQKLSIGDIVTFSYENHTRRNVLVNPKICRLRNDVSWQNVIESFKHQITTNAYLRDYRFEHWTTHTMRKFMENFATERKMDPLHPETWYKIDRAEFYRETKGRLIVQKYGGFSQAVQTIFPEIEFDESALNSAFWGNPKTRREFFEQFAAEHGFDPLNPNHWYKHRGKLLSSKYAKQVTNYYNQSITKALLDLFPEIGLDKSRLIRSASEYKRLNRRKLFENYAKTCGFDPLLAENWYFQTKDAILRSKKIEGILLYHGGSVVTALLDLFPEIGLSRAKLVVSWAKNEIGRKFFENYAKANRFDALNHENWYLQSKAKIKSLKGATRILRYYSNSVSKALIDLFPDVTFDKSRLLVSWTRPERRREFFEKYAQGVGFDPYVPGNWYSPPAEVEKDGKRWKLEISKGFNTVVWYHSNSVVKALLDLFPEIGLDKAKLELVWKKPDNRRDFFENYAKRNGFDPLVAENWYSSPIRRVREVKGLRSVISAYANNVSRALSELFPEIGFDRTKFWEKRTKM